jgi:hypothetical protein
MSWLPWTQGLNPRDKKKLLGHSFFIYAETHLKTGVGNRSSNNNDSFGRWGELVMLL